MTYELQRWTLEGLLPQPGTPECQAYMENIEKRLEEFETQRETLSPEMSTDAFAALLQDYEALYADLVRLRAYSYLWFSEDTANQEALSFQNTVNQFMADAQNRSLFFTLWWRQLDDAPAERLLTVSGDMRYYLESMRQFKPYTLSEAEERIINLKDVNGIEAILTLYDMLTTGFSYTLTVDGEEKTLTRGELQSYAYSPDPELRKNSYHALYAPYQDLKDVLAQMYALRLRDWHSENLKLRGFSSPISVRNLANDIPDAVVETLLEVIRKNVGLFQRYFHFKAQALGMEQLRRYDIYAPVTAADKTYTFDEAMQLIDTSYRAFSPTLADMALRIVNDKHLDAEARPRKMDGAYCYSVLPGMTPWVLSNYAGKINDVSTLAHELGHAVHGLMAGDHSPTTFHSSLPLSETASVFGEMLLNDKLLAEETDPEVRRTVLNSFLGDNYATIIRQAFFVLFEKEAHRMVQEGATPAQLQEVYLANLREQFGDAVAVDDLFALEWLLIPHIYDRPFYCYAYAFGNLLVLALYRKYKEIGREAFEPQYLRILAHGGATSPDTIIKEAGFDMSQPEFWQGGFDLLAEMLDELEKLA